MDAKPCFDQVALSAGTAKLPAYGGLQRKRPLLAAPVRRHFDSGEHFMGSKAPADPADSSQSADLANLTYKTTPSPAFIPTASRLSVAAHS